MTTTRTIDPLTELETARLRLRPYRLTDAAMLFEVAQHNRAHLERYESGNFLFQAEDVEGMIATIRDLHEYWQEDYWYIFGAFEKATGDFVAQLFIGLAKEAPLDYDIGYFADVDHTGRGYVTEGVMAILGFVFEHLHAHRASLHCDDTNVRSQRVAERCGFKREGHIREDKQNPDGSITGTLHYGMLRSEYES